MLTDKVTNDAELIHKMYGIDIRAKWFPVFCFRETFKTLNEEWINKYFKMEDIDYDVINNPEKHIIKKEGRFF